MNGKEIEGRFSHYLGLVEKGVAGFVVFGGELETVRRGIGRLQDASHRPLIVASDLEQGLGQQIAGGTLFPPAMAIASALRPPRTAEASPMLRKLYDAFAAEARYAGINTILAPVMDINTNPLNPVIATRAFGEDSETVSFFGCEMIRQLQENGIMACAKHFPGHGDTGIDSHIALPVIRKGLSALEHHELIPFKNAVLGDVGMIMLGHLSVPSLDPSGKPASISERAVSYLRSTVGFRGVVITDAMNMGALGGYDENEASLMALNAGVDFLLHPTDPDVTALFLRSKNYPQRSITPNLTISSIAGSVDFGGHGRLSRELSRQAVAVEGQERGRLKEPFVLFVNDEQTDRGDVFLSALRPAYPQVNRVSIFPGDDIPLSAFPAGRDLIVCVFSQAGAWKGTHAVWLRETLKGLASKAKLFISFGNPYVITGLGNVTRILAFWAADSAQEAAAEKLLEA